MCTEPYTKHHIKVICRDFSDASTEQGDLRMVMSIILSSSRLCLGISLHSALWLPGRCLPSCNPCPPLGRPPPPLTFPTEYLPTPSTDSCTVDDSWQMWQEFVATLCNDLIMYLIGCFKSADIPQNKWCGICCGESGRKK